MFKIMIGLGLILFATGCAPLSDVKQPSSVDIPMKSYKEPYIAAPLDRIILTKKSGNQSTLSITNERKLEYPPGQNIEVTGMTPAQIEEKIKKRDPEIQSIAYEEFHANRVALTGEVNIQTHLDLQDAPIRMLDAIAAAGGFTPLANTRRVRLLRQNAGNVEVYELNMKDVMHGRNMQQNLSLQPGDSIFVPRTLL